MADQQFRDEALKAHNDWRMKHGCPPMELNKVLSAIAQKWAEKIASADQFQHSNQKDRQFEGKATGENIAMKWTSSGDPFTGTEATGNWYSEIERYDFRAGSGPRTGHFTQVVWRDSKLLGVGKAKTKGGKWLVVANYFPAGNFVGEYVNNVPPPVSGKIEMPKKDEPKSKPSMPMGGGGGGGAPSGGSKTMTSTRTETTKTADGKTIVKTIVTETTTDAAGNKSVKTKTTTQEK